MSIKYVVSGYILAVGNSDANTLSGTTQTYYYDILSDSLNVYGNSNIALAGNTPLEESGSYLSWGEQSNILAIGSPNYPFITSNGGRVRVFELILGIWTLLGGEDDMAGLIAETFAGPVSINSDGSIVVVGEPGYNQTLSGQGRARVYKYNGANWIPFGNTDITIGNNSDSLSGKAVSINSEGTIISVGEPGYEYLGSSIGRVRIFKHNLITETWDR